VRMAARAWNGNVRPAIRRASADVKVAASGMRRLRNLAFMGGNAREDGKKCRN
jgi:hypothetical protein